MTDQQTRRIGVGTEAESDELFPDPNNPALQVTILDELQSVLDSPVTREPVTIPIKTRPQMAVRYNANIDGDLLQAWNRSCTDRKDRFDNMKFARMIIANQAQCIVLRGIDVTDENGGAVTFSGSKLLSMTHAATAGSAIDTLFGDDALILATSRAILEGSGYGDEYDELLDPTLT